MNHRIPGRALGLSLLIVGTLLISGSVMAIGREQVTTSAAPYDRGAQTVATVGMSELMSQTFEFIGTWPAGWQVYDTFTHTFGTNVFNYSWMTTNYTQVEGARSAVAIGLLNGSPLTDTAIYTEPVDVWMIYGPVNLASTWQSRLDWKYLYQTPLTPSAYFSASVSTDYDPINRTGTFADVGLAPTADWVSGTLDLSPYVGPKVYVAFHYGSPEGGRVTDGPFVDDVHLRANYRVLLPLVVTWSLDGSISASAPVALPGQLITYTITVHNRNQLTDAANVVVSDTLPAGAYFQSADGAFTYNSGVVSWSNLTVPANGSVTLHITIRYDLYQDGSALVNGANVSIPAYPSIYAISPVTVTTGQLTGSITSPVVSAFTGDRITYTLTVNNSTSQPVGAVAVSDTLPANVSLVGADPGNTFDPVNRIVSWSGLTIPAGSQIAQHLTVQVGSNPGNAVINTAVAGIAPYPRTYPLTPLTTPVALNFTDDFSNPSSGWPLYDYGPSTFNCSPPGSLAARYITSGGVNNGPAYGISVACAWNGYVFEAPVRAADPANFVVQADMRSNQDFLFQTSYGLFFNGSENLKQLYTARIFQGLDPMDLDVRIWYNSIGSSDDPNDMLTYGKCWTCNANDYAWNTLAVQRQGNSFSVYAGPTGGGLSRVAGPFVGGLAGQYMDSNHTRVGVHQGNFEWAWRDDNTRPLAYIFDNFGLNPARH
jgi:uncharacterized repeat protein (TIGR01451 family)